MFLNNKCGKQELSQSTAKDYITRDLPINSKNKDELQGMPNRLNEKLKEIGLKINLN